MDSISSAIQAIGLAFAVALMAVWLGAIVFSAPVTVGLAVGAIRGRWRNTLPSVAAGALLGAAAAPPAFLGAYFFPLTVVPFTGAWVALGKIPERWSTWFELAVCAAFAASCAVVALTAVVFLAVGRGHPLDPFIWLLVVGSIAAFLLVFTESARWIIAGRRRDTFIA